MISVAPLVFGAPIIPVKKDRKAIERDQKGIKGLARSKMPVCTNADASRTKRETRPKRTFSEPPVAYTIGVDIDAKSLADGG
ncbi:hypothetical protein QCA50_014690 [Cerrena zonata]|uniref:Uncharacterized protein n=1 Tax=Cerrena zonata TaxID=2478898 RepID=A0AAW0FV11_9APHY